MLLRMVGPARHAAVQKSPRLPPRLAQMASHLSTLPSTSTPADGTEQNAGVSLVDLPKSCTFTTHLPPDPQFPTPLSSQKAKRTELGPRIVKGALFTYVRPETKDESELLAVSTKAMRDIGLRAGEESTELFKEVMVGNKFFWEEGEDGKEKEKEGMGKGIYPWAQCYGGWQFGSWAGQLGDGRAISLFEATNPSTGVRYELQLKGAGMTPYSRFADGKAVLRSSIREFVVSEALDGLGIPTTRALALTLTPKVQAQRERFEPSAIVCRFAQSWLRIGTFDIMRARGDRKLIRRLADYLAEHVFGGWDTLPQTPLPPSDPPASSSSSGKEAAAATPSFPLESPLHLTRYAQLYRHICILNARTVAAWQAYGFTNGVLNTDNTSLMGLSLDFGPFAFLDNFDPAYTPNHDDHALRYSYRNQPSVIWWNLVRLGETLGELIGAGPAKIDDATFVNDGVEESFIPELAARAEAIILAAGQEFQSEFLAEYKRLMTARLGLRHTKDSDFDQLFSELLDTLEALELDFNRAFRTLSHVRLSEIETEEQRRDVAGRFAHSEGFSSAVGVTDEAARKRLAAWLARWRARVVEDWGEVEGEASSSTERGLAMLSVNPKFIPRGWVLDEIIRRVEKGGERAVLQRVMRMVERPFEEVWFADDEVVEEGGTAQEEAERWCGDVPKRERMKMCSCSS